MDHVVLAVNGLLKKKKTDDNMSICRRLKFDAESVNFIDTRLLNVNILV